MRAMLEDERCSLAAISSMTARSSRDSRSASLGPVAVLRGMRDLVSCRTCFIVVYCDHLIAREIILVSKKIPVKVFV